MKINTLVISLIRYFIYLIAKINVMGDDINIEENTGNYNRKGTLGKVPPSGRQHRIKKYRQKTPMPDIIALTRVVSDFYHRVVSCGYHLNSIKVYDPVSNRTEIKYSDGRLVEMDFDLQAKLQSYVNCFRLEISPLVPRDTGMKFKAIQFPDGILIDLKYGEKISNSDEFLSVKSIREAFSHVGKRAAFYLEDTEDKDFIGKIDSGVNPFDDDAFLVGDGVSIVKRDFAESNWSIEQSKADVKRVLNTFLENMKPNK